MTEHRPKTSALIAYSEGLLSAKGDARVRAHLQRCAICVRELAAIKAYERTAQEVRAQKIPELDYSRMELALAREADHVSREMKAVKRRTPWAWAAVALAAAVILGIALAWPGQNVEVAERPRAEDRREPVREVAPIAYLAPVVTLAAGSVTSAGEALEPGAVLNEGDWIRTGQDGVLHVRLSEGTGFVAEARSALRLSRAREGEVSIALSRGRVSSTVARLEASSRYVILCAGYEIEVRGTRFAVSYVDSIVGVDLDEGLVVVRTPDGRAIELRAPERWRSSGEAEQEQAALRARELRTPAQEPTRVTLRQAEIVRWSVDATEIATSGPVHLRLPMGEHPVQGWDARGRLFTATLPVGREPVEMAEGALVAEAPRVRPGHLEPSEIQTVLRRASLQRNLRMCHERAMRVTGRSESTTLRTRITLGHMGDVQRVTFLDADQGSEELRSCVRNYAGRWTFPPPGGPFSFDVPLRFGPQMSP